MRMLIALFVLLSGCNSTSKYLHYEHSKSLHQCSLPNLYFVDQSVPKEYRSQVDDAFKHWNTTMDRSLFISGDNPDLAVEKRSVIVKSEDFRLGDLYCTKAIIFTNSKSCIVGANIYVNPHCYMAPDEFNSAVRHNIGLVLGLNNTMKPGTVMYYGAFDGEQHPIDINDEEKSAVNDLYGW